MGIHVIQSQQIGVLVEGILLRKQQPSSNPFAVLKTEHFVVPSPALETWLTQKLAEKQGISANTQFHQRIRGFQWFCYQQVLEDKDHVRRANIPRLMMKWRIYQTLKSCIEAEHNPLSADHPLYSIIQRIYDSAVQQQGLEQQLKKQSMLYWIAEQVSKLFSHYMVYRGHCQKKCEGECHCPSNWLSLWGVNQAIDLERYFSKHTDHDLSFKFTQAQELEAWQRWLWQQSFHDDFLAMQAIDEEFWHILDDATLRDEALKQLPEQITIFTLLDLAPVQLQFLRRLGQYIDVLILHYNPSQEYWADSVDPNWKKRYDLSVKARFIEKNPNATDDDIAAFFEDFTLNFNAEVRESRHPLLTRFGKQARDHFSLLSNLSSGQEGQWVDAFVNAAPQNLLSKIQSDILYLVEPTAQAYPLAPKDDSIQVHVCHSGLRQLEVLKEQLIFWLSQGTPEQPRRPSDILILVPDLKQMEPLIRSVFPQSGHQSGVFLPVKIAGVTQIDVNNAWRAVLGRIQWTTGRLNIEEFADWLNLQAVQIRYALDMQMTERMIELLTQAGFKRGLDAEHLQNSLSAEDQDYRFTLKFALDRLALGIAIPEHTMFDQTLSYARVLPSDFELISKLIEIYQDFATRRDWLRLHEMGAAKKVEQWLEILKQEIDEFKQAGVDVLDAVYKIVAKQYTMLTLSYHYVPDQVQQDSDHQLLQAIQLPLSYLLEEIQNTLESQLEQALPTGHITFSQLGHIRPIPYPLMVMLNLDSGKFPNRNTQLPFDLMGLLKPVLGDRSRLDDDQGAFLDALLLAQEHLWLFYNGFDVNDGEVRDPSSALQELLSHLALIIAVQSDQDPNQMLSMNGIEVPAHLQQLYHVHPLQPFDPEGFQSQSTPRYKDQWFAVAQGIQHANSPRTPWVNATYPIASTDLRVLDAGQWIQDVSFPARLYLKTLGVENLKPEDLPVTDEPLILDGLGRYALRDFLQQYDNLEQLDFNLLQDQLPVGKVQHSTLHMSRVEHQSLQDRLHQFAEQATATTQRQWHISKDVIMNITVPQQLSTMWVSLDASSARAKRRVKVWLEYLLWLAYLKACHPQISDAETQVYQRVAVFSDVTLINTGVTATQAQQYIQQWFNIYDHAQTQPVVLPAALMLILAEKGKSLEWEPADNGRMVLANFKDLQKEWDKSDAFLPFSLTDKEWSKKHQDWQFILQEQDATALLKAAIEQFAHDLYQPIDQYQTTAEE